MLESFETAVDYSRRDNFLSDHMSRQESVVSSCVDFLEFQLWD